MKTGKKSLFSYLAAFFISFFVGLFAGKLAMPISATYATNDISVNEVSNANEAAERKNNIEEVVVSDLASANSYTSYASSYTASANSSTANASYTDSGLYIPTVGFYSNVTNASTSGNTVNVPASGVAKYGSLIVGHNPGTFSSILGMNNGDVFYLYGQAYQVYSIQILEVSNNMKFVGTETTASLSNGSKGLVLMTCYGSSKTFSNGTTSASHRFLVYAKAV